MYLSFSELRERRRAAVQAQGSGDGDGAGEAADDADAGFGPDTGVDPGGARRRTTARVSSVVIALGIVSMLTDISSESTAAILPLYLTGVLGLSVVAYGVIDGLYQGVSAVVRIAAGYASDRGDNPKWIALFGYGVSAIARVGLLFASGFAAITAVVVADRLGKGARTAPRDALVTASSDPANLGRSFGVHRMLDNIGAAVGPLLAFVVLLVIPDGYSTVFVVSLAFAVLGVIVLGLFVPNVHPRARQAGTSDASKAVRSATAPPFRWRHLANPRLRRVLVVSGLFGVLSIGDGFIYLTLLQNGDAFATQWFPMLYVGTNVAFLLFAVPMGRLSDRFGSGRVFVAGHLALLAAYVIATVPAAGPVATILCLTLLGLFYAATDGVLAALASQSTPAPARASGIAAAQTVVAVTRLVAATGFGLLWVSFGRAEALWIVAGALVIAIPVAAWVLFRTRADEDADDGGDDGDGQFGAGTASGATGDLADEVAGDAA